MKKTKIRKIWNMKVPVEWTDRLAAAAEALDMPACRIVREATEEKLEQLAEKNPKVRAALAPYAA